MKSQILLAIGVVALVFTGCTERMGGGPSDADSGALSGDDSESAGTISEFGELEEFDVAYAPESVEYFAKLIGDTVHFELDKSTLSDEAELILTAQANWLGQNAGMQINVEGHADERGTREYNLALGARRAEAVRSFLIQAGIDPSRIGTVSYGKERPIEACSQETCWSKNRRAVSVVSGLPQV